MASSQARVSSNRPADEQGRRFSLRGALSSCAVFSLLSILSIPIFCAAPAAAIRLCMLPPVLPFPDDDERRNELEQIVTRQFSASSIDITSSTELRPILEQVAARSGAIFDPVTGRLDASLRAIHRDDVEKSVQQAFGCAGFVSLQLAIVRAYYDGVSARWDGQTARVNSGGRIAGRVAASVLLGAVITETGWVPALSLWIRVTDLHDRDVAFRSAGVEPLMDFSFARGKDLLPEDRWLRDAERVTEAVDSALGPDLSALKADTLPTDAADEKAFHWE